MIRDSSMWNADCGFSHGAKHRRPRLRTCRNPKSTIRQGVTLIELLIVMAIIATLSTVFLGVSSAAMDAGRASRTKATIAKIHSLLMERWESYETRRIDLDTRAIDVLLREDRITARQYGEMLADMRLLGVRELMKLEIPDRWSDIIGNSVSNVPPTSPASAFLQPVLLSSRPGLTTSYLRRYTNLKTNETEIIQRNQEAECLYMTIMLATGDGEARTLFGEQDIGDTDGDGAPEFLDGWGRPIQLIRWPAGFEISSLLSDDADADHDPMTPNTNLV